MARCLPCEVGWQSSSDPCWCCGRPGEGTGTYASPGQTQEAVPTPLLEQNRRWMATADVASLLADA